MTDISSDLQDKLDAAAFRRLLSHLDTRKDVQMTAFKALRTAKN